MIIRNPVTDNFSVITNRILTDRRLSAEAVGVLCYLASKPDHWKVRAAEIESRFGLRTKKRQRIMRELDAAGYLQIKKGGPDGGYDVTVFVSGSDYAQKGQSLKGTVALGRTLVKTETTVNTDNNTLSSLSMREASKDAIKTKRKYERKLSVVERAAAATARVDATD